ncbi:MAG TPA: hypothetical protein VFF78_03590, partial [Anaerolineaceae bacterium]|nr:hypothetical protein [Anaerolineaceae bacterium]
LGRISAYNGLFPGRARFPFGENPAQAYNFSLYSVEAMFAAHEVSAPPDAGTCRVFIIGDSSTWGTLLKPEETLAGQLNALELSAADGRRMRFFNLGYPTLSTTKDLMLLQEALGYAPDAVLWLVTLEGLPDDRQLDSPLVANNAARVEALIAQYGLTSIRADDPALVRPDLWARTILGQRRALADLLRLQLYGPLWSSTGIDQFYPAEYDPAQRDLEADATFNNWPGPQFEPDLLAWDVLEAGMGAAPEMILVNEPILISQGLNRDVRYNFFYPRWAYDQYRALLSARAAANGWNYLDLWDLVPQEEFTNSAIHLTPAGEKMLAEKVAGALRCELKP